MAEASVRNEQPNARDPEVAVTVPKNAPKKWEKAREFALGIAGARSGRPGEAGLTCAAALGTIDSGQDG
ncbi:hypothetical protein GCM10017771_70100 [Streptomyces capitiformicae]|uniref:Uncharacterized protein n=1 Tax=Streptomyces capitiformicae TaxID=2014920 RepID=A0A918ZFK5_9ACTN|nr:hypothetical protein GCM10017771_70100 [Streptomyces capitiformicae]